MPDGSYGMEVVVDLYKCKAKFTAESITRFLKELVDKIKMEPVGDPVVWVDDTSEELHIKGVSALQWIKTSNIIVHAIDHTRLVLLNVFSCKEFDPEVVVNLSKQYFNPQKCISSVVKRGESYS